MARAEFNQPQTRSTDPTTASSVAAQAWITRFRSPLQAAGQGSLAGLTFAVKDNIDVAGVPTTAGCPAFAHQADQSATVVRRCWARPTLTSLPAG